MKLLGLSRTVVATSLFLAISCVPAAECENPPRLRFSLVPQGDTRKDAAAFRPLFEALERELGKPVEVVFPSSYDSVVEGLLSTGIDLAMMGPASYAAAKNSDSDVQAFSSYSVRAGAFQEEGSFYRALLIVRSDSRFSTRESLRGARLALVDPVSTSGAILPRHLFSAIIKSPLEQFFGRVVYTGGHYKSAAAVSNGQVDAAFISSFLLSEYVRDGKARTNDYQVLWRSEPIPLDPFVYRGRLCEPIKKKIRKVFLEANGEEYREMLEKLNAVRFSPIGDDSYKKIREILRATP
jgi:phosphonate transport system substrate-binding protein